MVGRSPGRPPTHRLARAAVALPLLLAVVVAAFPDVLFGGRTLSAASYVPGVLPSGPVGAADPPRPPPVRDVEGAAWVDEPQPYLVHRALADGELPLWNAGEGLGAPLLGNPNSGALAPLQLPANLWPGARVQDLTWIARALLLGAFTWLLARELGCGGWGSLAAAISLMLSGQTLEWIDHHPLNTDVFVPLALYAALRLPASGRRGIALLAAACAAALLGLKPQSALVGGAFGLLWLLAAAADDGAGAAPAAGRPRVATRLAAWLAGIALAGALAGVALVPFVETYEQASGLVRAGRSSQSEWTLPPADWWSLVGYRGLARPSWAGVPAAGELTDVGGARGKTAADAAAPATLPGLPYAGGLTLVAAAFGLWRARHRRLAWALALTVAALLGKIFGFLPIGLARVPLLGSVNYVKYCFPLYLGTALLCGLALAPGDGPRAAHDAAARPDWIAGRGALAGIFVLALTAELLWLAPARRPARVPLFTPAPYVDSLRALIAQRPGRVSGPIDLSPPLASSALGLRDLRAIDVLTPRATWELVSRAVAPSQGVTWILADPDPLLAATAPGGPIADLRYVLSRSALAPEDLPRAVRSQVSARRLIGLFSSLRGLSTETSELSGGIRELAGDRRFHWVCRTPCRLSFELDALPDWFAVGIAGDEPARVTARVAARDRSGVRRALVATVDLPAKRWRDLWLARPEPEGDGDAAPGDSSRAAAAAGAAGAAGAAATPGSVEIVLESDRPVRVFVGGVGPSAGESGEAALLERELAYRRAALARLELRYADATAHVYESPLALGAAYLASAVERVPDGAAVDDCLLAHAGERVACVSERDAAELADAARRAGTVWPSGADGSARAVADRDALVSVEADSPRGGLLVVTRLFYPGWQATIDDGPASIVRVNGALCAVVLPPGAHRVTLSYRPASVAIGGLLSLAGLVVLAGLLVPSVRSSGRRR